MKAKDTEQIDESLDEQVYIQRAVDALFTRRQKFGRLYSITLNTCNLAMSLLTLSDPINDEKERMAHIYIGISILMGIMLAISCKAKYLRLVPYILFILTLRNAIRLVDFERSKLLITRSAWTRQIAIQSIVFIMNIHFLSDLIKSSIINAVTTVFLMTFLLQCIVFCGRD